MDKIVETTNNLLSKTYVTTFLICKRWQVRILSTGTVINRKHKQMQTASNGHAVTFRTKSSGTFQRASYKDTNGVLKDDPIWVL